MKRFNAAALFLALSVIPLAGCETVSVPLDPLAINGRDGGGKPIDYNTVMRIGAAAQAGGDLATALGLYRHAAAMAPQDPVPFVASGDTLVQMHRFNEAIVAYNSALARSPHDPAALRGLARGYLMSGKPQLAARPLAVAYRQSPNDPKLLELIGVADDLAGEHAAAQARYRRGLELSPRDPALSLDLALSLALTGDYSEAITVLRPIAMGVVSTPRQRQTLALIYGLQGNDRAAARIARLDLGPAAVQRNLAYYNDLRRLSPRARARAIQSLSMGTGSHRTY